MTDFQSIPILDFELIKNGRKTQFLDELRNAFVNVGFCYLKNPPVDKELVTKVIEYVPQLFDLPQEEKDAIDMVNSPHFLGYTRYGMEYTRGAIDQREQFDIGTEHKATWKEGDPDYQRLWGEPQWPKETSLPGFRETFSKYLAQVEVLSFVFIKLLAESLYLPSDAFDKFYDEPHSLMQHRGKIVKYPLPRDSKSDQGVGAHFDGGFLTFLLQVTNQPGLQVQNLSGKWIDAGPIENTLVVNIGKGLETATEGVARATSHRVLSPSAPYGPRYSVPFFQNISQAIRTGEMGVYGGVFPEEIQKLLASRAVGPTESINFSEYDKVTSGHAQLIGRIKSHPNVGKRHYPAMYHEIFGDNEPKAGEYQA